MRAYSPRKEQTRHTAGAVGVKFNHPRAHQPQKVAPLSFPLWDSNALPWWACDRQTFQMRCAELHQAKAWGKGQDARVGSGVEGAL